VNSLWSYDGTRALDRLAVDFARRGYRVVLMTEHDRGFTQNRFEEFREACARVSTPRLLVVPGIEYSDSANAVHILVWGRVPFIGEGLPTNEVFEAVRRSEGVAVFAHPSRRNAWRSFEPRWAESIVGIEAWNRKYDGWAPSVTAPDLLERSGAIPFVGLDFHSARQFFPLAMMLNIVGEVTEDSVLDCLRMRRCHPRAFGVALDFPALQSALPLLSTAERTRRTVARITRRLAAAVTC
jgi:hypothetical protein